MTLEVSEAEQQQTVLQFHNIYTLHTHTHWNKTSVAKVMVMALCYIIQLPLEGRYVSV